RRIRRGRGEGDCRNENSRHQLRLERLCHGFLLAEINAAARAPRCYFHTPRSIDYYPRAAVPATSARRRNGCRTITRRYGLHGSPERSLPWVRSVPRAIPLTAKSESQEGARGPTTGVDR